MTAAPRFTVPRDDRRECALYRIYVLHPVTGKVVLGYIGETARQPWTRFMEHLYDQPWGDTIVGHPHVDPRVFSGKPAVLAAEGAAVLTEKPLYNVEYQKGAPHAIPQWTAREQRAARDQKRGAVTPDWTAKGQQVTDQLVVRTKPMNPNVKRRLAWTAAWFTTFAAVWVVLALAVGPHWHLPWREWPILAAGLCAEPLVLLARAGGRRKTRDLRQVLAGLIAVATVVLMLVAR